MESLSVRAAEVFIVWIIYKDIGQKMVNNEQISWNIPVDDFNSIIFFYNNKFTDVFSG